MSEGDATKSLTERFIDAASAAGERALERIGTDEAAAESAANASLSLMQSAALAGQYERLTPRSERDEDQALAAYRALAQDLERQFRDGGTPVSLRIAGKIRGVIDQHG